MGGPTLSGVWAVGRYSSVFSLGARAGGECLPCKKGAVGRVGGAGVGVGRLMVRCGEGWGAVVLDANAIGDGLSRRRLGLAGLGLGGGVVMEGSGKNPGKVNRNLRRAEMLIYVRFGWCVVVRRGASQEG